MRTLTLLLLLASAAPAPAGHDDDDARAAFALALARPCCDLCPCSQSGTCSCVPGNECGCLTNAQYRWVATDKANQTALYRGREQLGNYWHAEGEYRRLTCLPDGSCRWAVMACPVGVPTSPARATAPAYFQPSYQPVYRSQMAAPVFRGGGARCSG